MSETNPTNPDPEIHAAELYSVEETSDANRRLVSDSYVETHNNVNERQLAVQRINLQAMQDPAYYAAAAAAATEAAGHDRRGHNYAPDADTTKATAGVNENLKEALSIPMVRVLEKPYDIITPQPLTEQEKMRFNKLIDFVTATGTERYGYYSADRRAVRRQNATGNDEVTNQEQLYWHGTGKNGNKGKLDILAAKVAQKLEENPHYRELLLERQQLLTDQLSGAGVTKSAKATNFAAKGSRRDEALADQANPDYIDAHKQIKDGDLKFDVGNKGYKSWYNNLPEENKVPLIGASLRGLAGMNPTQSRRRKMHAEYSTYRMGEGIRDPHAKPEGYAKTLPDRESEHWIIERDYRAADASLHLAKASDELNTASEIEIESRVRLQTLLEVTQAAENKLAGEDFMQRFGRPEAFENSITTTLSGAFEKFSSTGTITYEDDHAMFADLATMAGYVEKLDAKLEAIDPDAKPTSFAQLVELRSNMTGLLNRSRYRREQLRIGTASNVGASQADGFFGQRGSSYVSDKGIEIDFSGVILYEDGTVYDPAINPQGHRSPNGNISPPQRNEELLLPPVDHSGKNFNELKDSFEISLKSWFETQSDSAVRKHTVQEYAIALKDAALDAIMVDPDSDAADAAYEAFNKAQYWVDYIQFNPGEDTSADSIMLKSNGSIEYEKTTFNGIEGNWVLRPNGATSLLFQRADGSKFTARRYAPNGVQIS